MRLLYAICYICSALLQYGGELLGDMLWQQQA
jgi:hypothetical protein